MEIDDIKLKIAELKLAGVCIDCGKCEQYASSDRCQVCLMKELDRLIEKHYAKNTK